MQKRVEMYLMSKFFQFFQCFWLIYAFLLRMIACTLHIEGYPWHQPQRPQHPQQPQWPQLPLQPHFIKKPLILRNIYIFDGLLLSIA